MPRKEYHSGSEEDDDTYSTPFHLRTFGPRKRLRSASGEDSESDISVYTSSSDTSDGDDEYISGHNLQREGIYDTRILRYDKSLSDDSDGEDEVRQRILAWEISQMQGFGTTDAEWDGLLLVLFLATMLTLSVLIWRYFRLDDDTFFHNPWLREGTHDFVKGSYP